MGFVAEMLALERVFFEYFDIPCRFSFHRLSTVFTHPSIIDADSVVKQTTSNTWYHIPQDRKLNIYWDKNLVPLTMISSWWNFNTKL
jgi:hypothetical protein